MQYSSIAGPDLTANSAPASVVASNFSILYCTADYWLPIETTWAEVLLGACLLLTMYVCERKRKTEKERVMTDSLAGLSAATRFPLRLLSCPSPVPLVSPNFCTPQVLFSRPAECPSDRETAKEKPGEKAEMKQRPISHVVLGSCLPPKT